MFAPIFVVSVIPDICALGPRRLIVLLALLAAAGGAYYLGIFDKFADWIGAGDHACHLLTVGAALMVLAIPARVWLMHRRFLQLDWPRDMSWGRFQSWCEHFLTRQGWETNEPKHHTAALSFTAKKGNINLNLICSIDVPTRDILNRTYRIGHVVFVCLAKVPQSLVREAAQLGVRVLTYRDLRQFDELLSTPFETLSAHAGSEPSADFSVAWALLRSSVSTTVSECRPN